MIARPPSLKSRLCCYSETRNNAIGSLLRRPWCSIQMKPLITLVIMVWWFNKVTPKLDLIWNSIFKGKQYGEIQLNTEWIFFNSFFKLNQQLFTDSIVKCLLLNTKTIFIYSIPETDSAKNSGKPSSNVSTLSIVQPPSFTTSESFQCPFLSIVSVVYTNKK